MKAECSEVYTLKGAVMQLDQPKFIFLFLSLLPAEDSHRHCASFLQDCGALVITAVLPFAC